MHYGEDDEVTCPMCGYTPTCYQDCGGGCEEGWFSLYDEDPLYYNEDDMEMCDYCYGAGIERWCPDCGHNFHQVEREGVIGG